jgi:hypothetical protein
MDPDAAKTWLELADRFGLGALLGIVLLVSWIVVIWGLLKLLKKEWAEKEARITRETEALGTVSASLKELRTGFDDLKKAIEERNKNLIRLFAWLEAKGQIPPGSSVGAGG